MKICKKARVRTAVPPHPLIWLMGALCACAVLLPNMPSAAWAQGSAEGTEQVAPDGEATSAASEATANGAHTTSNTGQVAPDGEATSAASEETAPGAHTTSNTEQVAPGSETTSAASKATADDALATSIAGQATTDDQSASSDDQAAPELELSTVDEVLDSRMAGVAGLLFDKLLEEAYPEKDLSGHLFYYNTTPEVIGALKAGKVDAYIADLPVGSLAISRNDGIGMVPEPLMDDRYGYILRKGSPLTPQVNERIAAYQADGTVERLYKKWTGMDEGAKTMPDFSADAPNGVLMVATSADTEPMTYMRGDGEIVGFCPELMGMIAQDLGYRLEYRTTNNASQIAEVQSGKADISMNCFSITDERKEVVDMTIPFYEGGTVAIVRLKGAGASSEGFFGQMAESFERTFITEDRWRLIVDGLGVTLAISVASGSLGCALGYALVLLRRRGNRLAEAIIRVFEALMGGLPVVVILMVLYYVVFGTVDISGVIVSILGFTMIFGAGAGSIMWNAIQAVDVGQTEAGRALGFSSSATFSLVVMPQAGRRFAPLLRNQFVGLVKDTSVVGFIAVQDLTRVADIIRGRTMEAFFPLVAIAVIYFVLCRLLAFVLDRLIKALTSTEGPRTIKGVEL